MSLAAGLLCLPQSAAADQTSQFFDLHSIAISPDGQRVYAGQGLGAPYSALSRDSTTGLLSFLPVATFSGNHGGGGGEFRRTIVVSPDSRAVYDSLNSSNALRQMTVSGESLLPGVTYSNYSEGITGMTGPQVVSTSPDGACLYLTAVNSYPGTIVAFKRDAQNDLTYASTFIGSSFEYWDGMGFSPDGSYMYVAAGTYGVYTLSRNGSTCALTSSSTTSPGGQLTDLAVSADGRSVYVVDPYGKHLFVFSVNTSTGALTLAQTFTEGTGGATGLDGADGVVVSPDGKNVYTVAAAENALDEFSRDTTTGSLTLTQTLREGHEGISGLANAQSLVISPDGKSVYAVSAGSSSALTSYLRTDTGALTFVQKLTWENAPRPPLGGGLGGGSTGGGSGGGPSGGGGGGPAAPPGRVGVSINDGDYATNSPRVHVHAVWPLNASTALVSNDGGFLSAIEMPLTVEIPWTLTSAANERLPRTVYVRFLGSGNDAQTFTDDIILDTHAPVIKEATLLGKSGTWASASRKRRSTPKEYRIRLGAVQDDSGISVVEAGSTPASAKVVRLRPRSQRGFLHLSHVVVMRLGARPRVVRVQSAASTWSAWRLLH
jgi:DNA-binding beta-propeller fold protein YncE